MWKIPLFKVYMSPSEELMPKLEEILYSGFIAEGEATQELENEFRKYFDTSHVLATSSCTNGLVLALYASGVRPGHSVVTTPQTCVASACPIKTLGADIIWGDVDPLTGMLDPNSVEERIEEDTKAVIVVHWGGDVAKVNELREICHAKNVALIEDAAEALGARATDDKLVGQTGSDFTCFSFQAIKHLTTGDGGITVCSSEAKRHEAKLLSWFGIDRQGFRLPSGEIDWQMDIPIAGFKAHMNNITATIGLVQLKNVLKYVIPKHVENGNICTEEFSEISEFTIPPRIGTSAYWVYNVLCPQRDELIDHLINKGIQASRMHARIDMYSGLKPRKVHPLPGLDKFSDNHLCLPCGWWVTEDDIQYMYEEIKSFYKS